MHYFSIDVIVLLCWVTLITEDVIQAPDFTIISHWFLFLSELQFNIMSCLTISYWSCKSLLSLMHRALLWLCSLENVSDGGDRKRREGVRQDVDSIFWEAYEASREKTLVGWEWRRRKDCITESELEDWQNELWVLSGSGKDGWDKSVNVCCLAASPDGDFWGQASLTVCP